MRFFIWWAYIFFVTHFHHCWCWWNVVLVYLIRRNKPVQWIFIVKKILSIYFENNVTLPLFFYHNWYNFFFIYITYTFDVDFGVICWFECRTYSTVLRIHVQSISLRFSSFRSFAFHTFVLIFICMSYTFVVTNCFAHTLAFFFTIHFIHSLARL